MRRLAATSVKRWLDELKLLIIPRSDSAFLEALDLYESRPDKGFSMTDCISMNVCRARGVEEVLTTDRHFQQEGFVCLP